MQQGSDSQAAPNWPDIEAGYRAGVSLVELRTKHGVTMRALLERIQAGGWKRNGAGGPPPGAGGEDGAAGREPEHLPVLIDDRTHDTIDAAVDEAIDDIIASHKAITHRLRAEFDELLAEFASMKVFLASFTDADHIAALGKKKDGGKALRAYLQQCITHFAKRSGVLEQLARVGTQVVNLERVAWAIDGENGSPTELTYDDLLAELDKPYTPPVLPDNVVEFERKISAVRSGAGGKESG